MHNRFGLVLQCSLESLLGIGTLILDIQAVGKYRIPCSSNHTLIYPQNSVVGPVLLAQRDPSTPQKLLAQMDRLLQSHILPNFLKPYFSEMWVVNCNRLLCLHFGGLSCNGDQQTYVEEDISTTHNEILSDHEARDYLPYSVEVTLAITIIHDEAQYNLSFDRAVFTHLLEYHLLFLVKKFYSQLNSESDPGLLAIQIPNSLPFGKMFKHSYPTEKILAAFRGLYYLLSNSDLVWRPQIEFCFQAVNFLKVSHWKYGLVSGHRSS